MRVACYAAFAAALVASAPLRAANTGITYDCDTASGHFSELVLPAPAGPFIVEGRVRLQQMAEMGKIAPVTRISVSSAPPAPGQSASDVAGFALNAMPANAVKKGAGKGPVQFLQWDDRRNGTTQEHEPFGMTMDPQELSFRLAYDGQSVTVRIGDQEQRLPLAAKEPVVRVICSTGEFLYSDLRIMPQR